jgi:hypothetical protein
MESGHGGPVGNRHQRALCLTNMRKQLLVDRNFSVGSSSALVDFVGKHPARLAQQHAGERQALLLTA